MLAGFGELPYKDIVLVAGYPMSALADGAYFVIYRVEPPAEGHGVTRHIRTGEVTAADLARWR